MMEPVYVLGVGMTHFGRHSEASLNQLAGQALAGALEDAECQPSDIQSAFYSGASNGYLQGQELVPGQVVLSKLGLQGIPVFNLDPSPTAARRARNIYLQRATPSWGLLW